MLVATALHPQRRRIVHCACKQGRPLQLRPFLLQRLAVVLLLQRPRYLGAAAPRRPAALERGVSKACGFEGAFAFRKVYKRSQGGDARSLVRTSQLNETTMQDGFQPMAGCRRPYFVAVAMTSAVVAKAS